MRVLPWLLVFLLVSAVWRCRADDMEDEEPEDEEWEDTPITTQLWQLVSSNNVEGLNSFVAQNPQWVHLRSADGRGIQLSRGGGRFFLCFCFRFLQQKSVHPGDLLRDLHAILLFSFFSCFFVFIYFNIYIIPLAWGSPAPAHPLPGGLFWAYEYGHPQIISLLLNAGVVCVLCWNTRRSVRKGLCILL